MVLTHGLRGIRVVLAAAIAAGLCACGGDGEVTVPVTEQDALSTPQQVRAHLDFISSQIPLPGATPAVVPGPFLCESAGSRETSADTVDSPFTNPPLDVERVRFHDCMQYNGPPSDPQSSFVRQHGLVESGFAEQKNGTRVSYEGRGESASQPFERQVLDRAEDGVHELDHRFFSRTHQRERLGMFGLLHEVDRRMFVEHQLSILEPDGRRIEGRYRVGTPSGPFIAVARNSTYEIRGQYQIEAARCRTGVIQVETPRRLAYDERTGRITAGSLRFIAGNDTATVVFSANGTATLTGATGMQSVEDFTPGVDPVFSPCFRADP
ncbi:MAG: hypothetical protein DIU62_004050 [Pseudomonadota bacterium]|jgi:hypothetical protein|nr:MAG: hypothetical protein DIU62_10655 [Pseudomonadota bacterium]